MRMKIPHPIQLWFNRFNATEVRGETLIDATSSTAASGTPSINAYQSNPLLLIGLNNLIMEAVSSYPPPEGVLDVMSVICGQLFTFYRHGRDEVRWITLEAIPSLLYVYLYLYARSTSTQHRPSSHQVQLNRDKSHRSSIETEDGTGNSNPTPEREQSPSSTIHKRSVAFQMSPSRIIRTHRPKDSSPNVDTDVLKPEKLLDISRVLENLEALFLGIYNHQLSQEKQWNPEKKSSEMLDPKEGTIFGPMCDSTPIVSSSTEVKQTNPKIKQSDPEESNHEDASPTRMNFVSSRAVQNCVNRSNRMEILTVVLHQLNESLVHLSVRVHSPLHRLALLLDTSSQAHHARTLEQLSKRKSICPDAESLVDVREEGVLQVPNMFGDSCHSDVSGELDSLDDLPPHTDRLHTHLEKYERKISQGFHRALHLNKLGTSTRRKHIQVMDPSCPRVTGLKEEFVCELAMCLWRLPKRSSNEAVMALEALEARANYELWTRALLLINSVRNLNSRSYESSDMSMESVMDPMHREFREVIDIQKDPACEMNTQQLSIIGAYCGLWSDLVTTKKEKKPEESMTMEPMQSDLVSLARSKFMRSIVTNAAFETHKPPDDIAVTQEGNRNQVTTLFTRQLSSRRPLLRTGSEIWDGKPDEGMIDDIRVNNWHSPKDWFKKAGTQKKEGT